MSFWRTADSIIVINKRFIVANDRWSRSPHPRQTGYRSGDASEYRDDGEKALDRSSARRVRLQQYPSTFLMIRFAPMASFSPRLFLSGPHCGDAAVRRALANLDS